MTDLSRLIDNLCAGLEGPDTSSVSTKVEIISTVEIAQVSDDTTTFHSFQSFHSKTEHPENYDGDKPDTACFGASGSRVASSYVEVVETAERVETDGNSLARSTLPSFPLSLDEVERVETESATSKSPILNLNRAGPQRSDWWTGDLMAEVDRADPPPGDPLPISPSDVRAGVARELRALEEDGREGPEALRDAIAITTAKIRNSEVLAERQANGAACHVCDGPLDDVLPVIAVLTGKRGAHLFLHAGCHDAYRARRAALVDRIMTAAGYGETLTNGEAA